MAITTIVNQNMGTREFVTQLTGIFDNSTQEISVDKILDSSSIKNIFWAINSSGYITLSWDMTTGPDQTILIISGNGRWELGRAEFKAPTNATGIIRLTTTGFVSTDTYSIVVNGKL